MAFENIFRKASVTLVAGAYALFVEAASVAQAQTQLIAGSSIVGSGAPHVAARGANCVTRCTFSISKRQDRQMLRAGCWITQYKLLSKTQNHLSMSRFVPYRKQA